MKIKLIYKLIAQTKATKREEAYQKYILPRKGMDEVREDVEAWAAQKANEIAEIGNFGAEKIEVPHIAPNYKLLKA